MGSCKGKHTSYRVVPGVHLTPKFGPPFRDCDCKVNVTTHCNEDNDPKVRTKLRGKVDDSNRNINQRWSDAEHDPIEQVVDGVAATIHHPKHFASLSVQVPCNALQLGCVWQCACKYTYVCVAGKGKEFKRKENEREINERQ